MKSHIPSLTKHSLNLLIQTIFLIGFSKCTYVENITCQATASDQYKVCLAENGYEIVSLKRIETSNSCNESKSYGHTDQAIWVYGECSGEFKIWLRKGNVYPKVCSVFFCGSVNNESRYCRIPRADYILSSEHIPTSDTYCGDGFWFYGKMENKIWVDGGCGERFNVCYPERTSDDPQMTTIYGQDLLSRKMEQSTFVSISSKTTEGLYLETALDSIKYFVIAGSVILIAIFVALVILLYLMKYHGKNRKATGCDSASSCPAVRDATGNPDIFSTAHTIQNLMHDRTNNVDYFDSQTQNFNAVESYYDEIPLEYFRDNDSYISATTSVIGSSVALNAHDYLCLQPPAVPQMSVSENEVVSTEGSSYCSVISLSAHDSNNC